MPQKNQKNPKYFSIHTDFGSVEITPDLLAAFELLRAAAGTLGLPDLEFFHHLREFVKYGCPHCAESARNGSD